MTQSTRTHRSPQSTSLQNHPARVGIVTPCYNAEAFVEATIASVDAQTFTHWQHLLVNDGSTDATGAILDAHAGRDPRRQVMHQANQGQAATNNAAATRFADTVDYLLFLDADDTLAPRALETAVAYLDAHPEAGAVHWRFEVVDEAGNVRPAHFKNRWHRRHVPTRFGVRVLPDAAPEIPLHAVITHCGMIPACVLMRREVFANTTGFNESALFSSGLKDVNLFIQIALQTTIHRIPTVLTQYRAHENQVTADIRQMDRQYEELLRLWRRRALHTPYEDLRLQRALLFAECRKPTSDRLYAAACEWKQGAYPAAIRIWMAAVVRHLWSLLPGRVAAPLYLKLRSVATHVVR